MAIPVSGAQRRLSELVAQSGLSPFKAHDFYLVSGEVARDPSRLILVGGQALEVWGVLLKVLAPTGDTTPLTEDADWLGGASDADWLAGLLEVHREVDLLKPKPEDPTPNTASMYMRGADQGIVLLDFLRSITGLRNDEIERLAVSVELPLSGSDEPATMRVLHPIHCLASRMANIQTHEKKRLGNGPLQAEWAVNIVRAYLYQLVSQSDEVSVRRSCEAIMELAEFGPASYCYTNYGIDPLKALDEVILRSGGEKFYEIQWPNYFDRLQRKRIRWKMLEVRRLHGSGRSKLR